MVYRIEYYLQKGDKAPEGYGQDTKDFSSVEAAKDHADLKLRNSQVAGQIPSGVIATFIILESGKVVYPRAGSR